MSHMTFLFTYIDARRIKIDHGKSLVCYDGADCLQTNTCNECNGVGCIRMKSYNTEHIHSIALTCLPYATRIYQLEPAGCRISLAGDSEHCICYDTDYCNRATVCDLAENVDALRI
ncbi:unnamed protein product [Onchocerca ochengi]|uniref:DUF1540 domain-containing protein n=1 Tax=Onchocerca ochengi TaxID=42157 RepID=A0A182E1N6_ONCOC|nr:unnamed protein product [Onchocerca ochengi]